MPVTRSRKGSETTEQPSVREIPVSRVMETSVAISREQATTSRVTQTTPVRQSSTEPSTEQTTDTTESSGETADTEETAKPERVPKRTQAATKGSRPASIKSRTAKKRELEARAELAELELREAQAKAAVARANLELLRMTDDDRESNGDPQDREADVQQWLDKTVSVVLGKEHNAYDASRKDMMEPPDKRRQPASTATVKPEVVQSGNKDLAEAIIQAIGTVPRAGASASSYMTELPQFDGTIGEWIAFRTVYEDTMGLFTAIQNMSRLRRAIKGVAREAVKSLLYSECLPEDVMDALRRRFGRPETLVLAEMDKLKGLSRIGEGARDVCMFASRVNNVVATVKGLRKPQYLQSPEIMKIIVEKLPAVLRYRWFDYAADFEESDLVTVAAFLNREADRCGPYASQEPVPRRQGMYRQAAHAAVEVSDDKKPLCPSCQGEHHLLTCKKFLQASVNDKWDVVKKSGYCFKCLQGKHRKENCKKPACKECKRLHHHLLHYTKQAEQRPVIKKEVSNNVVLPVNALTNARVYLKMVPVEVYGPKGSIRILALLDEGSTVSLLDSSVAREVGASGPIQSLRLETVGGRTLGNDESMCIDLKLKGVHHSRRQKLTGVRTIEGLHLMPQRLDRSRLEKCAHLGHMIDRLVYDEEKPRLLIGQDNWHAIVSRAMRRGKRNQPVASLTLLGWVLHGSDSGALKPVDFETCALTKMPEDELERLIKDHFAIESLGVQPRRPTTDADGRALDILHKTSRRIEGGRYETGLLWRNDYEEMLDNLRSAENRLRNIEKKLDRDPELKLEYGRQVQHLLDSGYAEEVGQQSTSIRKWYLLHFAVTHPTKNKMRLVFDAAAKCGGKSLNDMLLTGPDLLQSLFGVLLRFRQRPVAVVADIKEMFLQVRIRREDRDSLRFLWRGEKRDEPPKHYRMTSVIFGAACSPSAAIYVKNANAVEHEGEFPAAAQAIRSNHYMDDYLHSSTSEEDAINLAKEVDHVHKKAGFELRGWASNRPAVVKAITNVEASSEVELGMKEEKTLGLRWFTSDDKLGFRTNPRSFEEVVYSMKIVPSKRQVTSVVMSTFDPMGLAAPVLIQGKRLIQDLWRSGVGWDDRIPPECEEGWRTYLVKLKLLGNLRVPRCFAPVLDDEGELHVFTDTSETAYACAVYWRQYHKARWTVNLLTGKARVAPLKPISIPRLELQAALLGTRLAHSVIEELDVAPKRKVYWTDSSTVLSWIRSDPRTFKPFVAHRLAEIEDTSRPHEWRWVPSQHNPADDATRGIPRDFAANHRWFKGPEFLSKDEGQWPEHRSFKAQYTGEEREAKLTVAAVFSSNLPTPDPARFSRWIRLWRATARVLQFIELCKCLREKTLVVRRKDPAWRRYAKKPKKNDPLQATPRDEICARSLSPRVLEKAEELLLRRSQECFKNEIKAVSDTKSLDKNSRLRRLDLTFEGGLLRIRGRINTAKELNRDLRQPIVLDAKDEIAKLLVRHYHERFNHGNHATVVNEIRQRFWIVGLRSAVRMTTRYCQWCRVRRDTPKKPPQGDLPRERLRYGEPPFTCTAVDYFGPMIITVGRRNEKRWGALFTCLTTRALHLELVTSLSTDSMILALRRMAARRGTPKVMFSDNGTNFVKANKELQDAYTQLKTEDLATEAEKIGMRWKFIPPGAPNMGGAWERLVGSVKTALAATLKQRQPKEEVLHTLLLEAEHIVNSRPLVEVDDPDEEALTPNHFLIGRSCGAPSVGACDEYEVKGNTWKATQRLADHFWARWLKEYLPTLVPRRLDGRIDSPDLRCGDVVLIVDPLLPRNTWPRGEVTRVYPGPDGRTRVVDVRTTGGLLKRPSSKVVRLVPAVASIEAAATGNKTAAVNEAAATSTSIGSPSEQIGASHEGEDVGDKIEND